MQNYHDIEIDFQKIERDAQRLRAQVMARAVKNLINWIRHPFSSRPQDERQAV